MGAAEPGIERPVPSRQLPRSIEWIGVRSSGDFRIRGWSRRRRPLRRLARRVGAAGARTGEVRACGALLGRGLFRPRAPGRFPRARQVARAPLYRARESTRYKRSVNRALHPIVLSHRGSTFGSWRDEHFGLRGRSRRRFRFFSYSIVAQPPGRTVPRPIRSRTAVSFRNRSSACARAAGWARRRGSSPACAAPPPCST